MIPLLPFCFPAARRRDKSFLFSIWFPVILDSSGFGDEVTNGCFDTAGTVGAGVEALGALVGAIVGMGASVDADWVGIGTLVGVIGVGDGALVGSIGVGVGATVGFAGPVEDALTVTGTSMSYIT